MTQKWKVAQKLIPGKGKNSNKQVFDNIEIKAEQFNSFFSNVGRDTYRKTQESLMNIDNDIENNTIPRVMPETTQNHQFFRPTPVSVEVVILTFKRLKKIMQWDQMI